MELITPFPQVACRVIDIKSDFVAVMSDTAIAGVENEEQKNAKHVFWYDELCDSSFLLDPGEEESSETSTNHAKEESSETSTNLDKQVKSYSFTWEALSFFKKSLRTPSEDDLEVNFWGNYNGSTMAGAYALPEILSPIYEEFFERYNIIDHKCNLNYTQRRFLVFSTCRVIHEMRIIKVVDVPKETILQWLGWISYIQKKGKFNVGIVAENIKQVWAAHYYIKSKKIVEDETSRIDRELEKVSMYQAERRTKMDELWYEVYEAEATRQKWLLRDKEHTAYTVLGSRGPMKKERSNALEIKWRSCYDSLILYPGNLPTK